jgi:SAM-dependent methyltransferase
MTEAQSQTGRLESWDGAEAYEAYMARWSRLVARGFVDWLAVPPGAAWLDVGCGTGGLTRVILDRANPAAVHGFDPSDHYLAYARRHVCDPRADFRVGKAQSLPVDDGAYDAVVSGLVLNFVPDGDRADAIAGMARATRTGGQMAAYVWDYADGMQFMRYFWDAVIALDPRGERLDAGQRFPFCAPDGLSALFSAAGLTDLEVQPLVIPTIFQDFDDYWRPFLGGQGSAPTYVVALPDDVRNELREYLHAHLPIAPDGSISLTARAWAIRGHR